MPSFTGHVYDVDFIRNLNDTQFAIRATAGESRPFFSTDFRFQVILAAALVSQTPVTIEYEDTSNKMRISSVTVKAPGPIEPKAEVSAEIETDSNGTTTRAKLHIE